MCREAGIPAPTFEEITGAAVVTFGLDVACRQQVPPQVATVLKAARTPRTREELQAVAVLAHGLVKERDVPAREIEEAVRRTREFEHSPEQHTY